MGGFSSKETSREAGKVNFTLIGAPNVGKSTIFQQFQNLYTDIFESEDRRKAMRCFLLSNILAIVVAVDKDVISRNSKGPLEFPNGYLHEMNEMEEFKEEVLEQISKINDADKQSETLASPSGVEDVAVAEDFNYEDCKEVSRNLFESEDGAVMIGKLVKHTKRPFFQTALEALVNDNSDGKLNANHIEMVRVTELLADPNFVPSVENLLRVRRQTLEAAHLEFVMPVNIGGKPSTYHVKLTDMGGFADMQEQWRNIIIKYKDVDSRDLTAFVINLSNFSERDANNRSLVSAQITLCEKIIQSELLGNTQMAVLINKMDLLEKRLEKENIADYVPIMQGCENTVSGCTEAVAKHLSKVTKKYKRKYTPIILHTCALDSSLMQRILEQVVVSSFQKTLEESGIL